MVLQGDLAMKNFIKAFIFILIFCYVFLFFGGFLIFDNFYALLIFVSLIITSVGTLFYRLFIRVEDLEARVKLLEEKLNAQEEK